jgi:dolichol-phosphate mannosyltransferase
VQENNISLIIPAYNEESRIEASVAIYANHFSNREIIVVCNGCVDDTPNIVSDLCDKYPNIKHLNFREKLGKGGAIKEAFKIAKGDIIGFVDADESVDPKDVDSMIEALSHSDGVIASRRLRNSKILIKQPFNRRIASKVFNIFVRAVFGLNFKDTQCGAKVFRKRAIQKVLPILRTSGFEFDVELLWRLKRLDFNVIEFPITWKHSAGSTFSLSKAPGMFFTLLKVRLVR